MKCLHWPRKKVNSLSCAARACKCVSQFSFYLYLTEKAFLVGGTGRDSLSKSVHSMNLCYERVLISTETLTTRYSQTTSLVKIEL